jgi:hypothetical protein
VYAGQPAPGNQYHEPKIKINGHTLQAVENFTYLGSTLSRNANIDAEIDNSCSWIGLTTLTTSAARPIRSKAFSEEISR